MGGNSSFATKFCASASVAFVTGIIWSVGSNQFENIAAESLGKLTTEHISQETV